MNEHQIPDNDDPLPTLEEMQRRLGSQFNAVIELRLMQLEQANCPLQASTLNGYLQGLYNAAALLGRMDRRLARAHSKAVIAKTTERMREINGYVGGVTHMAVASGVH